MVEFRTLLFVAYLTGFSRTMTQSKETEEQIFEAARRVFQQKGYSGARMQNIADEAGINKSMLHYYYRSKDKLFQAVFQEAVKGFIPVIFEILNADLALVPKVEKLIDAYHGIFKENPHLPRFVLHEMNQHPERFKKFMESQGVEVPRVFIRQIEEEIKSGTMRPVKPQEFIINIIALCIFPYIGRRMIEVIFRMQDETFEVFIEQRKKGLSKFIFNAVKKVR